MLAMLHRPIITSDVPIDGDIAHRKGYALADNPFMNDNPALREQWDNNWMFRHNHVLPTASDAPGGHMRPSKTSRAKGFKGF